MKNIRIYLSENFPFLIIKFSISYLNRHVRNWLSYSEANRQLQKLSRLAEMVKCLSSVSISLKL